MSEHTAPESTLPYPPIHTDKKFVVLSDWDGTITTYDSNDYLTDHYGFGKPMRRQGNLDILSGADTFRDGFRKMLNSVSENGHTFEECKEILKENIKLDPGFKEFYAWCKAQDIPVIIVSSGMAPLIRAVLSKLIGDDESAKIEIIANDVVLKPEGEWEIKFRHPSRRPCRVAWNLRGMPGFGHDKSQAIIPYLQSAARPTLFFFGDGVSDISAAKHADLLFVKTKEDGENDLSVYCEREGIKHHLIKTFGEALPVVQDIVEGRKTIQDVLS
ncbi:hypothetical protein D9619_007738 [Psilocybe cf. subviscida]|uniref:Phosphatase n=1 Tax=Psilocybe cf. subviscida TaxID=2480587 RepID=A0A8H5ESQ0_9AGAR|nr:hypothetical protein D9619_007738 [Psilocybe cf. subviscida]